MELYLLTITLALFALSLGLIIYSIAEEAKLERNVVWAMILCAVIWPVTLIIILWMLFSIAKESQQEDFPTY